MSVFCSPAGISLLWSKEVISCAVWEETSHLQPLSFTQPLSLQSMFLFLFFIKMRAGEPLHLKCNWCSCRCFSVHLEKCSLRHRSHFQAVIISEVLPWSRLLSLSVLAASECIFPQARLPLALRLHQINGLLASLLRQEACTVFFFSRTLRQHFVRHSLAIVRL